MDQKRQVTLDEYFASADAPPRPIMTSLNGDNSWLLSFPRPAEEDRAISRKRFYHVVFEPWLAGPASMVHSWFIWMSLSTRADVSDPAAIEGVIRQIEAAAVPSGTPIGSQEEEASAGYTGGIDAILLGFHYLDHLHEATLRLFDENIPVIATPEAIAIVEPWHHFKTIRTIRDFDPSSKSWREDGLHPGDPVPSWLTPIRLPGHHELNYCLALIWSHAEGGNETHEVIFQSPHGTRLDQGPLSAFLDAEPKTTKLAMLHGLKESHTAGMMTTLGVKGGLAFYRRTGQPKYWILSHHSTLFYGGIFMRLSWTTDTHRTVSWALEEEAKAGDHPTDGGGEPERPNVVQVENGGCIVLENVGEKVGD